MASVAAAAKELTISIDHASNKPLGAELTIDPQNGEILIARVVRDSLAETHGVLQGHQLVKINGMPVTGKPLSALASMLKGKAATVTLLLHNCDNPSLWAKMLSRGTKLKFKSRDERDYLEGVMWADCRKGTLNFAPERNAPAKKVVTLKVTDIAEICGVPPSGPAHDAHQKRLDMIHRAGQHAASLKSGGKEKRAWVKAQMKAHKSRRSAKQAEESARAIELACYTPEGYMILDHTKDLLVAGDATERDTWLDAIEWYHRVCRKHQMDVVIHRFKSIDKDHSGDIDISELKQLLLGVKKGAKSAEKLFEKYDTNGDGKLSFEEFVPLLAALEGKRHAGSAAQMKHAAASAGIHVSRVVVNPLSQKRHT